jgi:hypothetical protein
MRLLEVGGVGVLSNRLALIDFGTGESGQVVLHNRHILDNGKSGRVVASKGLLHAI